MAVERDKSRREGILLRMSTRDSVPLSWVLQNENTSQKKNVKVTLTIGVNF